MSRWGVQLGLLACASLACAAPSGGGEARLVSRPPPVVGPAKAGAVRAGAVTTALPNGLRVVVVPVHRRPVVSVRLVLGEGAATEAEGERGATYFAVEALGDFYEEEDSYGNPTNPGEKSLRHQVWVLGAQYRSQVSADAATIGIDGYAVDVERYLKLLGGAVVSPRQGAETFAARREAVYDAVEDLDTGDDEAFFEYLQRAAFGVDHVYARSIYGSLGDLGRIGHEVVVERQAQVLDPAEATLIVVGDVSPQRVELQAASAFGRWARPKPRLPVTITAPTVRARRSVVIIPRRPARTLAICGARPLTDVSGDDAALEVLAALLGRTSNSRLHRDLRERAALAYSTEAEIVRRRHARALFACTRVLSEDGGRALQTFLAALSGLTAEPPTASELEQARGLLIGEEESRSDAIASLLGGEVEAAVLRDPLRDEARIRALAAVSADDLLRLARALLKPDSIQLVLAGEPEVARRAVAEAKLGRAEVVRGLP